MIRFIYRPCPSQCKFCFVYDRIRCSILWRHQQLQSHCQKHFISALNRLICSYSIEWLFSYIFWNLQRHRTWSWTRFLFWFLRHTQTQCPLVHQFWKLQLECFLRKTHAGRFLQVQRVKASWRNHYQYLLKLHQWRKHRDCSIHISGTCKSRISFFQRNTFHTIPLNLMALQSKIEFDTGTIEATIQRHQ